LYDKVDFIIATYKGRRLRPPIEMQFTLRCNSVNKMQTYLRQCAEEDRRATRIYIESEQGRDIREVARKLAYHVHCFSRRNYRRCNVMLGLHFDPDGSCREFDMATQVDWLRRADNPLRRFGRIVHVSVRAGGKKVLLIDDQHGERWQAGFNELASLISGSNETSRGFIPLNEPIDAPVTFISSNDRDRHAVSVQCLR